MVALILAIALLIFTLILVLWQPKGLGIGWSTLLGAFLALVTGIIKWGDVVVAWELLGNSFLTLIAVSIICLILDEAGFFSLLARPIALLGLGLGWWLFCLMALVAAVATALFTNYGSILIWTPVVMETMLVLGFRPKPTLAYVLATGFIADAASLALPFSNLVNLFAIDSFQVPLVRYAIIMVPIHFVALTISFGVLWFYFNLLIPPTYELAQTNPASTVIRDPLVCRWGLMILGWLLLGYFVPHLTWLIAWLAVLFLFTLAGRWFYPGRGILSSKKLFQQIPWQAIFFTTGMYFLVIGLGNAGLIPLLSQLFSQFSGWGITLASMGTGFTAALLSSLSNNLPVAIINNLALQQATADQSAIAEAMLYANLIGSNLGAKLIPWGSLSTLLWLDILRRKGLNLFWGHYCRIHIALTIPVLLICFLILSLWLPWLVV